MSRDKLVQLEALIDKYARGVKRNAAEIRTMPIEPIRQHFQDFADELAALEGDAQPVADFQSRVQPWMMACFGPEISSDRIERGDRLLEEVFELLQSGGYDPARVLALRDYVWGRDKGEPAQEAGGVMVTLAAYCLAHELDMHEAGETELARIWTKVEKIRAKQAAKPVGSALPVATAPLAVDQAMREALAEATETADAWRNLALQFDREDHPMTDDLTQLRAELRHLVSLNEPRHGGPYGGFAAERCMDAMRKAADALDALQTEHERTKLHLAAWEDSARINRLRAEAAEARVTALEKGLEPFSDMAGEMFARGWDASNVALALDNPNDAHRVTAGDFFRARALLNPKEGSASDAD